MNFSGEQEQRNFHNILSLIFKFFFLSNVVHTSVFGPDNGKQTDREVPHCKTGCQLQRD